MKTTWDELMRYAPEQEIPLRPMQDEEGARILNKTMGKIRETKQKPARPVRTVLIAAAVAALLCGSAFAAHSFGWFDRLFGEKAALVEGHIASYDENTATDITQPAYTEEEQAMIAEGTMQVPDTADLADTGVSATTENFVFTLESMLASKDSVLSQSCASTRGTMKPRRSLPRCRRLTAISRNLSGCCGLVCATIPASARITVWNGKMAASKWKLFR